MIPPATLIFLAETVVLIALLARSWHWARYPCFTAMLIADLLKYALWAFYDPGMYVLVDGPVTALRVLASVEAIGRLAELSEPRYKPIALYLGLLMIGLAVGMDTVVHPTEISGYNAVRVALHIGAGIAIAGFAAWWSLMAGWESYQIDRHHTVLIGSLCMAYGIADAGTLSETDIDAWIWKTAAFGGVRVGIYYAWIRCYVPLSRSRSSISSLAIL